MRTLAAVALLVLAGAVIGAWTENVTVRVLDAAGTPVPDAPVVISYQKANANTVQDGEERGVTNGSGDFHADLENRVPDEFSPYNFYTVSLDTYFWNSSQSVEQTNSSGKVVTFQAPLRVEQVDILCIDGAGFPLAGPVASSTQPFIARRTCDQNGSMKFYIAQGFALEGAIGYNYKGSEFSSNFRSEAGRRERILFTVPISQAELNITVVDGAGNPLPGVPVRSSLGGQALRTDGQGVVTYQNLQAQRFEVYVSYGGVFVKRPVVATRPETLIVAIPSILLLYSVSQEKAGEKCVKLVVSLYDPSSPHGQIAGNATVEYSAAGGTIETKPLLYVPPASFANEFCVDMPALAALAVNAGGRELRSSLLINPYMVPSAAPPPVKNGTAGIQGNATFGGNGSTGSGGKFEANPLLDYLPLLLPVAASLLAVAVFHLFRKRLAVQKKGEEKEEGEKPQKPGIDVAGQAAYYARCLVKFVRDAFKK